MGEQAEVPDHAHISEDRFTEVYEPQEDTYFFLDALLSERDALNSLRPRVCLEIGSGNGCLTTYLQSLLAEPALFFATDTNPAALECTHITSSRNASRDSKHAVLELVQTDITAALRARLHGCVDVMLCNPPYVPTEDEEMEEVLMAGSQTLAAAWAGGDRGRVVIDRMLKEVPDLLAPNGVFYLLLVHENDPKEIITQLRQHGLVHKTIIKKRAQNELLYVIRFQRE